jgi:hypothetical protein
MGPLGSNLVVVLNAQKMPIVTGHLIAHPINLPAWVTDKRTPPFSHRIEIDTKETGTTIEFFCDKDGPTWTIQHDEARKLLPIIVKAAKSNQFLRYQDVRRTVGVEQLLQNAMPVP